MNELLKNGRSIFCDSHDEEDSRVLLNLLQLCSHVIRSSSIRSVLEDDRTGKKTEIVYSGRPFEARDGALLSARTTPPDRRAVDSMQGPDFFSSQCDVMLINFIVAQVGVLDWVHSARMN